MARMDFVVIGRAPTRPAVRPLVIGPLMDHALPDPSALAPGFRTAPKMRRRA